MRRIRVKFQKPQTETSLAKIAGVNGAVRERRDLFTFQVGGEMDAFIKSLAEYEVADIDVERPSLEEVFLAYYSGEEE